MSAIRYPLKLLLMKKSLSIYFSIFFFLFSTTNSMAQKNYTIEGLLTGGNEETIVYFLFGEALKDSVKLSQGRFALTGNISEPQKCFIKVKGQKGWASFILENSKQYKIEGKVDSISKSKISGSEEIELSNELNATLRPVLTKVVLYADSIKMAQVQNDTVAYNRYTKMHLEHRYHLGALRKAFILKYASSYTSLFTFEELRFSMGLTEQKEIFAQLSSKLKNHSIGQRQYQRMFSRN